MRQEVGRPRRVLFGRLRALPLLGDAAGLLDQRFLDRRDGLLLLFLFPDGLVGRVLGPPKPLQQSFQDVRPNR